MWRTHGQNLKVFMRIGYLDMCLLKIVRMGRRNINSRDFVEK